MKLTIKTVTNKMFNIEADLGETVGQLKSKIEKQQGVNEYPVSGQKLIYAGKILKDDSTLSDYKIDENGFLVIIISKNAQPPSTPKETSLTTKPLDEKSISSAQSSSTPFTNTKVIPSDASNQITVNKSDNKPNIDQNSGGVSAPANVLESAFVPSGPAMQAVIEDLMGMGFDKEAVLKALRASFNNPTRAVEYLINGIPPSASLAMNAPTPEVDPTTGGEELTDAMAMSPPQNQAALASDSEDLSQNEQDSLHLADSDHDDPLEFLRTLPQFRQMRELVQQNPNLLQLFVQQLGQQNPQLLQRITENQDRFIQMLNEPLDEGEDEEGGAFENAPGGAAGRAQPVRENQIVVTAGEREAIERLKAMGFPEGLVIQAYFACDKDENLAVNFLLTQNLEDDLVDNRNP